MNRQHNPVNLFVPNGKMQSVLRLWIAVLVGLLVVLSAFATADVIVWADGPALESVSTSFLNANPELKVGLRYVEDAARQAEIAFLDANPEMIVSRRDAEMLQSKREYAAFLAAHPEIKVYHQDEVVVHGR
jgi:hypothetical protein